MPFWGLQKQLGIDVDTFLLRQSMPQPHGQAAVCHAFEREWVECGHGLGQTRARRECQLEYEDFMECMKRTKLCGADLCPCPQLSSSSIHTQDKTLVRKWGWKPKSHQYSTS
uniref:NADH dehydrogenase [ubiquinone] iron-sulfur protein 5 isoform X1 n=1 Tax=Agelaius phoeniceus TaxID=39638 RepID=UPI0023EB24E1|nr:NADH dehydrogenase [ubiquinone] iron-sulfur protein 5 isoform X1 [Agelaius phoeniceus]